MAGDAADRIQALVDGGALDEALALAREALIGATGTARAVLLQRQCAALVANGQLLEGLRAAVQASELFEAAGRADGLCDALGQVAAALRAAGDHATALSTLEQAEGLARASGDPLRLARVLRLIGVGCSLLGRHQHALSCMGEALELFEAHGAAGETRQARLSALNVRNRRLPAIPDAAERQAEAEALLSAWAALARDCAAAGHFRMEVMAAGNHAITQRACGRPREAAEELRALLPRYREYAMRPNEGLCHGELGHALMALGDAAAARTHYREAVAVLRTGGMQDDLKDALEGLSHAEEALGDAAAALAALRELRRIEQQRSDDAARHAIVQRELRIELARLTSHWARLATQDALTGLANRRGLERWLDEHWPRVEQGEPLVLLLLDLDHFKRINDGFGHDMGDEVLRRVGRLLQSSCRAGDLAVRYGGEEFLLAMAGTARAAAELAAHRLRAAIEAHDWAALAPALVVTTSIGVADAREALDAEALLTLADRRLYAAKYAGRNQVVALD